MISRQPNSGFTLLEVMAALAIVATALVTLLGSHLISLNLARQHKEQTLLAMLARGKIEEIFTIPYDSLADDSGDFAPAHPEIGWRTEVSETEIENLKKVNVLIYMPGTNFELDILVARTMIE